MIKYFFLVTLLPILGFLVNLLLGKKIKSEKFSGWFSTLMVFIPFLIALFTIFNFLGLPNEARTVNIKYFSWLISGNININFAYLIDPLSIVMVLIITGVGFLIHIYSIGYMHSDPEFHKFFSYLNLFIFAMLNLVLADNFLLVFLGWEGVGLCSYLLIGFWYEKKFTGEAAKKAFVMNRIGDFGFLIAMFLIVTTYGTLEISGFLSHLSGYPLNSGILVAISLLFFLGATGKSAQIPLFVWLPDAMAGPTPVSALIHAATMVTAGVYLIARCSLLYAMSPITSNIILIAGLLTAFIAGNIALKQNDIKKILAYSTVSQLGFMFIALGTFSYGVAIFHLTTHAFFKALLFLGSGSVIHGMHEEQDITKMGGLKSKMKITFVTFFIGSLAISGIPPLSGFFSKDEILYKTFTNSGVLFYAIGLFVAALTAIYMFRLVALAFYGKPRYNETQIHPHESPHTMTIPLIILAILSAIGGVIGLPHFLGVSNALEIWLDPVFEKTNIVVAGLLQNTEHSISVELILLVLSVTVAIIAIIYSFRKYSKPEFAEKESLIGKILKNKYYIDEAYDKAVVEPIKTISEKVLWGIFDIKIIDNFINGAANYVDKLSIDWKKLQTGVIQDYATIAIAGIVVIIFYLLLI